MKWQTGRRSRNVVDRRGMRAGGPIIAGGGVIGVIAVVLTLLLGGDPSDLGVPADPGYTGPSATGGAGYVGSAHEEELKQFVSVVLADTEDTWPALLRPLGVEYQEPRLVLFAGAVESACGYAQSAVGPFYCPGDHQVYLDLGFFEDLHQLGAPGDFARAYVIAHEIGHHVQNLIGTMGRRRTNADSVRVELQADCFAGIWAHHAQRQRQVLEPGDVEEGLRAAASIGDDRLQRRAGQAVSPETFTHGSSEQRLQWFQRGLKTGSVEACDTFAR